MAQITRLGVLFMKMGEILANSLNLPLFWPQDPEKRRKVNFELRSWLMAQMMRLGVAFT